MYDMVAVNERLAKLMTGEELRTIVSERIKTLDYHTPMQVLTATERALDDLIKITKNSNSRESSLQKSLQKSRDSLKKVYETYSDSTDSMEELSIHLKFLLCVAMLQLEG